MKKTNSRLKHVLRKWYVIPVVIICLLIAANINKTPEVDYIHADWLYNPGDPQSFPYIAALQDFVFVGYVVSDPIPVQLGTNDNYSIFSEYKVRVLMNIRGELETGIDIPVLKDGGYDKKHNKYFLFENDSLPRKGEICVIAASTMTDGSYRLSTCGFTSFAAIGIPYSMMDKESMILSNGTEIDQDDVKRSIDRAENPFEEKIISLKSVEYIDNVADVDQGLVVPDELLKKPDSPEIRSVLGKSTLVKLWIAAVAEENEVESKRERIMDSPYGIPGSPSYT